MPFKIRAGKKLIGAVELSSRIFLYGHHTMYRKEKDGDAWDISTEALKRAGAAPQVNTCKIIVAGVNYSSLPAVYRGDDGRIVLNHMVLPGVQIMGSRKAEPPCMQDDLAAYDEYLDRIANAVFDIIDEEDVRLDKTLREEQGAAQ